MLDLGDAIARDDYETRRKRQADKSKYKGRIADKQQHESIEKLLKSGHSYTDIQKIISCSRGLIANVKKGMALDAM